jgi:hypothetical protein
MVKLDTLTLVLIALGVFLLLRGGLGGAADGMGPIKNPKWVHPWWCRYNAENSHYQPSEQGPRWGPYKYSYWW